jgi:hypothetical protein
MIVLTTKKPNRFTVRGKSNDLTLTLLRQNAYCVNYQFQAKTAKRFPFLFYTIPGKAFRI